MFVNNLNKKHLHNRVVGANRTLQNEAEFLALGLRDDSRPQALRHYYGKQVLGEGGTERSEVCALKRDVNLKW